MLLHPLIATASDSAPGLHIEPVRIGILAYRGKEKTVERWSATTDYLSNRIPGYAFEIVPLDLDEMESAVGTSAIDFAFTNPGNYVDLESRFGISRIVGLQTRYQDNIRMRYGAVIITSADNSDIYTLHDLRGKTFMAVSIDAFGGFQMAWREMNEQGINPFKDLSQLQFNGFPQDKIVLAVRSGDVDAGTVRSETLVRMIESGTVKRDDFRILNPRLAAGSPIALSTRTYPEWPLATLKNTPKELASRITQALLSMPSDHPAAIASQTAGWSVPLDYSTVNELMQILEIGPYKALRQSTLVAIFKRYTPWLIGAAMLVMALVLLSGYVSRMNHKLKHTQRNLRSEIKQHKLAQQELTRYRDTLEELVTVRTKDLRATNLALEKSRIALRKLVQITSAPDLSHDEKINRLLDTGRQYFGVPLAVLSSMLDEGPCMRKISGDARMVPRESGPVNKSYVARLMQTRGEPLDIPNRQYAEIYGPTGKWNSYLATTVMVHGKAHCALEFVGSRARERLLSRWDHDLLSVMAQWIGDELERQQAYEAQQKHHAELARVSRLSTIGEMAASLAHELNQPLTAVINYSNGCLRMLRNGQNDIQKIVKGMEHTVEGAQLAADIIRHIRKFVQKGEAERYNVDLNEAVHNVASLIMLETRHHGVQLNLDLAESLPPVQGNMIQLEQVILNLIRNAIDAMTAVEPAKRRLTIATRRNHNSVSVTAMDTGVGVPPESLSKIFDAFYTTKSDGVGIGLSISRSIIESHNGTIAARPRAEGGTEFYFELPAMAGM